MIQAKRVSHRAYVSTLASLIDGFDVNAADAEADQARREISHQGEAEEHPHEARNPDGLLGLQRVGNDIFLDERLDELNDARGPFAAALNLSEQIHIDTA